MALKPLFSPAGMAGSRTLAETREDLEAWAESQRATGKIVLKADQPEEGMVGYVAFVDGGDGDDRCSWPMFGTPLRPVMVDGDDPQKLLQFLLDHGQVSECDDPSAGKIGWVSYARAALGFADVLYITIAEMKEDDSAMLGRKMVIGELSRRSGVR